MLVKLEQYEWMQELLMDELDIPEAYPLMDEAAAKAGWDDPAMDIYNDLAPATNP
jgi:hypothetical protein